MKRSTVLMVLAAMLGMALFGFFAARSGSNDELPREPVHEPIDPSDMGAAAESLPPDPVKPQAADTTMSSLLAKYQCEQCGTAEMEQSPFIASSEAEARWMQDNAFPSLAQRAWTDRASLAEVEARASAEGGDMWALELARKRCAVGDPVHCAREEIGRMMMIGEDNGRAYAFHVLAESYAVLSQIDTAATEGLGARLHQSDIFFARGRAAQILFTAALRGDFKAEHTLDTLSFRMRRPWTAKELQQAFFAAVSSQRAELARARAMGRVPRAWVPRPSESFDRSIQLQIEWMNRVQAQHSAPPNMP